MDTCHINVFWVKNSLRNCRPLPAAFPGSPLNEPDTLAPSRCASQRSLIGLTSSDLQKVQLRTQKEFFHLFSSLLGVSWTSALTVQLQWRRSSTASCHVKSLSNQRICISQWEREEIEFEGIPTQCNAHYALFWSLLSALVEFNSSLCSQESQGNRDE